MPLEKKQRKPRKSTKPKMISIKKYVRFLNLIATESGYKLPSQKTIQGSKDIGILSYYLEKLFPDIIHYNVYKLTKEQLLYIMQTIYKHIEQMPTDEHFDIINRLKLQEVVRTFPVKKKTNSLPILEDMDDIQSLEAHITNSIPTQEPEQESEYPVVSFNDFIIQSKPTHTKLIKNIIPQKVFKDELEFYEDIKAIPYPIVEEIPSSEPVQKNIIISKKIKAPPKKRKIPKYEPPENYTDQQDIYSSYETYGDYKQRGLVFENATEYMRDLDKLYNDIKIFDKEEFIKKIKAQISKPTSSVLLDYIYNRLLPIHRRSYDISLIYDENNQELVNEDDLLTQQIEGIDEMSDILAKAQYSLDKDRYKQFLNDLLVILGDHSKQDTIDIVKNFFVKYKFITTKNIGEILSNNNINNYEKMIQKGDDYITQQILDNIKMEDNKKWEKHKKELDAEQKRRDKEEEAEQKRIDKQMERESKRKR